MPVTNQTVVKAAFNGSDATVYFNGEPLDANRFEYQVILQNVATYSPYSSNPTGIIKGKALISGSIILNAEDIPDGIDSLDHEITVELVSIDNKNLNDRIDISFREVALTSHGWNIDPDGNPIAYAWDFSAIGYKQTTVDPDDLVIFSSNFLYTTGLETGQVQLVEPEPATVATAPVNQPNIPTVWEVGFPSGGFAAGTNAIDTINSMSPVLIVKRVLETDQTYATVSDVAKAVHTIFPLAEGEPKHQLIISMGNNFSIYELSNGRLTPVSPDNFNTAAKDALKALLASLT